MSQSQQHLARLCPSGGLAALSHMGQERSQLAMGGELSPKA